MIKSLKVQNLNHRLTCELNFHEDINIVTGKNGSGKTTLLKLLWYAMSGNLERILPEITFESFELHTDKVFIGMKMGMDTKHKRKIVKLKWRVGETESESERPVDQAMEWDKLNEANRGIARATGHSIFFPTFRRIEGGFSISTRSETDVVRFMRRGRTIHRAAELYFEGETTSLQQAMNHLSERLSVKDHRFVVSISTDDIVRLLTSKYAEISEKTNRLHMDLSKFILERVRDEMAVIDSQAPTEPRESREALGEIRQKARNVTQESESLLRPFTVLSELIASVFQYKGIKLADPVTLGEAREAIASHILSSGEKQMLSFLCYNAFANQASLFIDEPEISLHVDWQRILFPLLLKQSTGNQFIVATHSPFIYSKYADKELMLAPERGGEDADAQDE